MIDDSHFFRGWRIGAARLDNTGKIIGQRDGARFRQASLIRCVRGAADKGGQVLRPGENCSTSDSGTPNITAMTVAGR